MKKIITFILFLAACNISSAQWTAIDTADINAIWLVEPDNGWSFQQQFKHWDGASWSVAVQDSAFGASCCAFPAANNGWAFGYQDSLYRFDGSSWTKYFSGMPYIRYCDFYDSDHGWALTGGLSYKYHNGIWTPYPINLPSYIFCDVMAISASDSAVAWISGIANFNNPNTDTSYLLKFVTNQWVIDTAIADTYLFSVCFTDQNHGWASGLCDNNSVIYKYNGSHWSLDYQSQDPYGTSCIYMYDNNHGWASSESRKLYNYDGFNWFIQDTTLRLICQFSFANQMNGWALGRSTAHIGPYNVVYSTTTGGFGMDKLFYDESSDYLVFPNPATTTITLNIPAEFGLTGSLEVYNSLGRVVEVHALCTPLDVRTWTRGLYFVAIKNDRGERLCAKVVKE